MARARPKIVADDLPRVLFKLAETRLDFLSSHKKYTTDRASHREEK